MTTRSAGAHHSPPVLDPSLVVEPGGHRYFEQGKPLMSAVRQRAGARSLATYLADGALPADRGNGAPAGGGSSRRSRS
ncbi:MAG TPA: hypothetical protein VII16_16890, partial [Actinomycetes bacterium]